MAPTAFIPNLPFTTKPSQIYYNHRRITKKYRLK